MVQKDVAQFWRFRAIYLFVFVIVMLADGMQGTHLFTLYSNYNYNVASLYASGFLAGTISSLFMGPIIDKCGRRRTAIVYCVLEIGINVLEQYKCFYGLLFSRIVGGITNNILFTVFESWVVTEHRARGFPEEKIEVILRDSVIASNLSAIVSGVISHHLASHFGTVGPFQGAVCCTFLALIFIYIFWGENYGFSVPEEKNIYEVLKDGIHIVASDTNILRIGLIQGLTEGTLQTFIFLWCPTLLQKTSMTSFSHRNDIIASNFVDYNLEPAYGLIFGIFMTSGVLGGLVQPVICKILMKYLEQLNTFESISVPSLILSSDGESLDDSGSYDSKSNISRNSANSSSLNNSCTRSKKDEIRLTAVKIQSALCFLVSSILLAVPIFLQERSKWSFTFSLLAFLFYEFLIGMYLPCQGTLRSIYLPGKAVCTIMTLLRVVVNIIVAIGVYLTNFMPLETVLVICAIALALAAIIQISLIHNGQLMPARTQYPEKIRVHSITSIIIEDDFSIENEYYNGNAVKQKSD